MNFDMPKAVFCGLALIAAAIYFGPGSAPASARPDVTEHGVQKVVTCDKTGLLCAGVNPFHGLAVVPAR